MNPITPLLPGDLPQLSQLQPPDWDNITPHFQGYLQTPFCHPFKIVIGPQLVAIGTAIFHKETVWLAHIITHPEYRNQGLGQKITQGLVNFAFSNHFATILLIATKMGEPVYQKIGFKTTDTYAFYQRAPSPPLEFSHPNLFAFEAKYTPAVLQLDQTISGEDRSMHLRMYFQGARVFIKQKQVQGFYLPMLGDGLIVADQKEAGLALMHYRLNSRHHAVLPVINQAGNDFLLKQNFVHCRTAKRMYLGKPISWKPEKLYNRVSGRIG